MDDSKVFLTILLNGKEIDLQMFVIKIK